MAIKTYISTIKPNPNSDDEYYLYASEATNASKLGNVDASNYAKLNSPSLTGTPTAPTAAVATSTSQIATTAFVQTVVSNAVSIVNDSIANATHYKGDFTASGDGLITGGSTTLKSVAEKVGDMYVVSTAGTYCNQALEVGDAIIFKKDVAAGTAPTSTDITFVEGTVSVSANNPVLSWGTQKTIGTVEGVTLSVSLPANPNTDYQTTLSGHYDPSGGSAVSPTSGSAVGWSGAVLTGITIDSKGHITGATKGSIPADPNTDRYVNSASFADDTTANASNPIKMTLTRSGSDSVSISANIPKVTKNTAGVVPKGESVSSQTQSTKFLRSDGTWAVPSYTTNTDRYVNSASFGDNTTSDSNNPLKMVLTRSGSDSVSISATLPKVTKDTAGVVPKGNNVTSQTQATKFLREDGTWAAPSYTTNTNTHRPIKLNDTEILGNNTTPLNLSTGTGISMTNSSGTVTISTKLSAGSNISLSTGDDGTVTITGTKSGTVTKVSVSAGSGISVSGSPITSTGTITISHASSSISNTSNTGRTYIQNLTFDGLGHITGISSSTETVTNTDRYVNNASFADDTTANALNPVKMTLKRSGSDSQTITANIPKVTKDTAGVAPKGNNVTSQTQSTKFLREDGTWATPSYTTNTDKYVNAVSFAQNTTDTNNPVKLTLTRSGSDSVSVSGNIPKVAPSVAGVVPAGNSVTSQTQATKFLREDGTWAAPSYTTNTNTHRQVNVEGVTILGNSDTSTALSFAAGSNISITGVSTGASKGLVTISANLSGYATETYVNNLVANATHYKGDFNASNGNITGGGSLTSVAEKVGDMYVVSTAGTYAGTSLEIGDSIIFKKAVAAGTAPVAGDITFVESTVSVTDNNPTLSWNSQSTVGTVEGVALHVKLPAKPTYTLDNVSDGSTRKLVVVSGSSGLDSVKQIGSANATGDSAAAFNSGEATGSNSFAEGDSYADGECSHAEGFDSFAEGDESHAEGTATNAMGESSHSEGNTTTAAGARTHAEGYGTSTESSFTITGSANATSYTSSAAHGLTVGDIISYNGYYAKVATVPTTTSFTTDVTLSSSAISAKKIYVLTGIAYGDNSHSEGWKTIAGNNNAHAEGWLTKALGHTAHAEGRGGAAKANYSHTEGRDTTANGEASHAEGYVTTTSNQGEHAEGKYNISISGSTIHTVGVGTGASAKKNAHTITTDGKHYIPGIGTYTGIETTLPVGQDLATIVNSKVDTSNVVFEPSTGTGSAKLKNNQAIASGQYSTALGVSYNNTVQTAGGDASIVEGAGNITKSGAQAAHAEGVLNVAGRTQEEAVAALADFPNLGGTTEQKVSKLIGFASHSEGSSTQALGSSSHAEGNSTQALVNATHAEGDSTTASGEAAHSEGYNTTASGKQAHAEGYKTEASANQSHAEGQNTKATSGNAHAEGYHTEATSENAHAEGNHTTANGNASHAEGFHTVANNNVEHAEGQYNVSISNVTCHTVGIGNSSQRKNAHTITTDGKHYIPGIGTYQGTETTLPVGQDLATIVNSKTSNTGTVTSVSAGTGLSISGTASVNPTVNIASGYKLPTTTEWNGKAPTSHASTATTYGVGTTSNYGHIKTQSGDMNGTSSTDGIAAGLGHTHSQYSTTDTKNTAGSTDTSSKIFLVGATSQAANPQTYSDNEVFTTSGVLTTKSVQVGGGSATMEYDSTNKCVKFIFS